MATTGEGARKVNVSDLRGMIVDSDELKKGTELFDAKALQSFARFQNKLYAEAKGSSFAPYRVSLVFSETSSTIKASCTCMAARSRDFCKHAAALLVAWSRAPESFVVSDAPLGTASGDSRRKSVKKGDADPRAQRLEGIQQVSTLVRELGVAGVGQSNGGGDQLESIQRIGEALRENKLRRLGARTLDLAAMLKASAAGKAALPATAYTDLLADLRITARKLTKHLAGEPIEDRHVEELIGKTWAKADRKPVTGLDLVEYAYLFRTTSDGFKLYESRFVDLATGTHYSEKQIDPPPPAPSREPKAVRAGAVLANASGTTYPTFSPLRLQFTDLGDSKPVDHAALTRLVETALPDVGAALSALQEHRKDVFAPDLLPVTVRIDTLFARGDRLQAVDATGNALHLPPLDPQLEDRLGTALHEGRLEVLIGDVGLDAALPTLWPHAVVIRGPLGLELRSLVDADAPTIKVATTEPDPRGWAKAARAAGTSEAAITLGEVREELADAFVLGLAGLGARTTTPLASRLRDLGLEKPAALLESLPQKAEPSDRIDEFIKLFQVIGIALMRLAGTTPVDRAALAPVPTYESVFVAQPDAWIDPERVEKLRGGEDQPLRGRRSLRAPLRGPARGGARRAHLPDLGQRERAALRRARLRREGRARRRRGEEGARERARARRQDHGDPRAPGRGHARSDDLAGYVDEAGAARRHGAGAPAQPRRERARRRPARARRRRARRRRDPAGPRRGRARAARQGRAPHRRGHPGPVERASAEGPRRRHRWAHDPRRGERDPGAATGVPLRRGPRCARESGARARSAR